MARDGDGVWWVQAAGRVWGPYAETRVAAFVAEGRVAAETLMAPNEDGPFAPAAQHPALAALFGVEAETAPAPDDEAEESASVVAVAPIQPAAGEARALLVWTALASVRPERLERALAQHGPIVRIGRELWLVRARTGAAALRNDLTRDLGPEDRLMVAEAELKNAAWFNLAGDTDRAIREWTDGEGA
jgi:hypothetical protein